MPETFRVTSEAQRQTALRKIAEAPLGFTLTHKRNTRTNEQNSRMWAMLTKVSEQKLHNGMRLSPEDWKILFMDALNQEMRVVANLSNNGLIQLGRSSSALTKQEMSDLMELITMYADEHEIDLGEPE